jgi:phage terminase Nu1 subunit (DNA packaging protein)
MDATHDAPTGHFKPLLKRKGLAIALDCSLRTIDNLQAAGMPCLFIGRSRRFIADEVIAWLKRKGSR